MRLTEIDLIDLTKRDFHQDRSRAWKYDRELSDRPAEVKKFGNFTVYKLKIEKGFSYKIEDSATKKAAGYVTLDRFKKSPEFYTTAYTSIAPQFYGQGLATKFYAWLILNEGIPLTSSDVQSPGGRTIWRKLSQDPRIYVYAYDYRKKEAYQIDPEDFTSSRHLYSDERWNETEELESLHREYEQMYDKIGNQIDAYEGLEIYHNQKPYPVNKEKIKKLKNMQAKLKALMDSTNKKINNLEKDDPEYMVLVAIPRRRRMK